MKVEIKKGKTLGEIRLKGSATLVAGVLKGATNEKGDSVAYYAMVNEYGTERIPARPFMRNTVNEHSAEWKALLKQFISAGVTPEEALEKIRNKLRTDIMATIKAGEFTPNAPATVARKKRLGLEHTDTPLIETTALYKSINTEIRK
jgi:hypothetical protein